MELPKNTFYKKTLDEDQQKFFDAIKNPDKTIVIGHTGQIDINGESGFAKYMAWFEGQERCEVCQLTKNYRGWLSTYADMLEE